MDLEKITNKEKEALDIARVSESELDFVKFRATFGEEKIETFKHDNGDLEISLEDETFMLKKDQVKFLIKWLSHSR